MVDYDEIYGEMRKEEYDGVFGEGKYEEIKPDGYIQEYLNDYYKKTYLLKDEESN